MLKEKSIFFSILHYKVDTSVHLECWTPPNFEAINNPAGRILLQSQSGLTQTHFKISFQSLATLANSLASAH